MTDGTTTITIKIVHDKDDESELESPMVLLDVLLVELDARLNILDADKMALIWSITTTPCNEERVLFPANEPAVKPVRMIAPSGVAAMACTRSLLSVPS